MEFIVDNLDSDQRNTASSVSDPLKRKKIQLLVVILSFTMALAGAMLARQWAVAFHISDAGTAMTPRS